VSATLQEKAEQFLTQKHIAVVGVSTTNPNEFTNMIYRKFRDNGFHAYAVNPKADTVEGEPCYPTVKDVPVQLDGVVIGTTPAVTDQVVRDCLDAGVTRVWMHKSVTTGSVSPDAVAFCQENGIMVIDGACPMMFLEPDIAHKCMKWVLGAFGKLPE
jgi:hypothetical protein